MKCSENKSAVSGLFQFWKKNGNLEAVTVENGKKYPDKIMLCVVRSNKHLHHHFFSLLMQSSWRFIPIALNAMSC